jgi:anti-sigma regulatory factor (Ser/Thr protein kinase)
MNRAGLNHQGVVYRDLAELADVVAPELDSALAGGRTVLAIVDERTAGLLRDRLGSAVNQVVFTDPDVAFAATSAQTLVARRRREAAELVARFWPITVVGQFQSWMAPSDVAFWESMFNLVLAELAVTLICACPAQARAAADVIAQTHPRLRTPAGVLTNDQFREPLSVLAEHPPPVPPPLGTPTGAMSFRSPQELPAVRAAVKAHGQVAGLGPTGLDDAVLAVSEAATNCVEHGAGHGWLLMWATGRQLIWEVHDPGRPRDGDREPDLDRLAPKRLGLIPPEPQDPRGRGMWVARGISDSLHVWSDGNGTSIRGSVSR